MVAKKKKNIKAVKVLHVTDFELIFEPSDAKRKKQKGPLSFTKSLVTTHFLSKAAEIRYFERMRIIKAHKERHLLRSIFEDLKNWTAGKYLGPRGFLVNADGKPASFAYLADQLDHVPIEDLRKALPILERIGIFDRKDFKGFPDAVGRGRTQPAGSGRRRKPLNKGKGKGKDNGKSKSKNTTGNGKGKDKSKNTTGNGKGKNKSKNTTGNGKGKDKSKNTTSSSKGNDVNAMDEKQNEAESTTTKPLPTKPQDPATRGGARLIKFPASSRAIQYNRGQPRRLGEIIKDMRHRYDLDAKKFGGEIYRALNLPWDPSTPQGRRELGSFASVWMGAKASNLSPPVLAELWNRAVIEAKKISKRRSRCDNISAVWCYIFGRLLAAAGCKVETV